VLGTNPTGIEPAADIIEPALNVWTFITSGILREGGTTYALDPLL